ncbi:signal transduction protein [Paenibacillus naphthalenovorans]|uniref:signal transduction protein n=1 Tax=Paenibacillus naphthalenovorans TaxID=162209 RepID=UPI003D2692BA
MSEFHKDIQYEPQEWVDEVIDESTGQVIVEGTPVNERQLNRMEAGILLHTEVGLIAVSALQRTRQNRQELDKWNNQRLLQGTATITAATTNGYFRDSEPFVQISPGGFAQINAPDYDVLLTPLSSDDLGRVGELIAYDKTQNGFKVKMTGSASTVTFLWTLINPRV